MTGLRPALWWLVLAGCGGAADGVDATETSGDPDAPDTMDPIDTMDTTGASDADELDASIAPGDAPTTRDTADAAESETDGGDTTGCARPFEPVSGPPLRRGARAADFEWPLADGRTFSLAAIWTGCETIVVIPDRLGVSALDPTSLWERDGDLATLVAASPEATHYLFVATDDDPAAPSRIAAMQARVEAVLAALPADRGTSWRAHLHVAADLAAALGGWPADALDGAFPNGFAIAPDQTLRGLGSFADVTRYDRALADAGAWPWENNLAYAAHEARYLRAETASARSLAAERATIVEVFRGETLSGFAEADVTLPAGLRDFDTLEVEVALGCPDPDRVELGNCGAWDYLASLSLVEDGGARQELARFITPYHREAHWVADASFALAWLEPGTTRRLRWEFAPEWNPQPTATRLALRFSNRGRGMRPVAALPLFTGGDFGPGYNDRAPIALPIPATTRRAEVWLLVTGHGGGQDNCAEFCDHTHLVAIGDARYELRFPEVGDDDGCVPRIERGMTPNQAGTWWLGRAGWCPGAAVEPWIIDATADVAPGADAVFDYRGLIAGADPPANSGAIALSSYLVLFE